MIARGHMIVAAGLGVTLMLTALAGCGAAPTSTSSEDPDGGPPGSFIAFARDFADFRTWQASASEATASGNVHLAGARTVYINKPPAAGATSFETGTLIVKEIATGEIFARAKRGGGYNPNGAVGWEWFEFKNTDAGLAMVWRGITPPAGACPYGGLAGGVCNDCHKAGADNDYVLSPSLKLQGMSP